MTISIFYHASKITTFKTAVPLLVLNLRWYSEMRLACSNSNMYKLRLNRYMVFV